MRQVARIELPSTRAAITFARRSAENRVLLSLMPDPSSIVNRPGVANTCRRYSVVEEAAILKRELERAVLKHTGELPLELGHISTELHDSDDFPDLQAHPVLPMLFEPLVVVSHEFGIGVDQ